MTDDLTPDWHGGERPDLPEGFELVRYSDNLRRSSINVTPEQLARLMRSAPAANRDDAA